MPRIKCPEHGVKRIELPWARPGSDFTLLFEQAAMSLVKEMPVLAVSRQLEISDKRLWRLVHHYVGRMLGELDLTGVAAVGVDETASRRGQRYVTVFLDMQRQQALDRDRLEELVIERTRDLDSALQRERSAADLYRNFAAMVSHQFRTPLAVVDSTLQRLIRRGERARPGEVAERANRARRAIAGLTRLVDSTLDTARLDAGQIGAHRQRCCVAAITEMVCARQAEATSERRIIMELTSSEHTVAFCDPTHVEQILENLLSNAVKYAPHTALVTVRVDADSARLICDVHHDGPPIATQDHERLFERNYRGANSAGITGTGIGLFMARTLARMQGGELHLHPTDQGVTFRLTLPRFAGAMA